MMFNPVSSIFRKNWTLQVHNTIFLLLLLEVVVCPISIFFLLSFWFGRCSVLPNSGSPFNKTTVVDHFVYVQLLPYIWYNVHALILCATWKAKTYYCARTFTGTSFKTLFHLSLLHSAPPTRVWTTNEPPSLPSYFCTTERVKIGRIVFAFAFQTIRNFPCHKREWGLQYHTLLISINWCKD